MDYFEVDEDIDQQTVWRCSAIRASAKTALWAGARDERFVAGDIELIRVVAERPCSRAAIWRNG